MVPSLAKAYSRAEDYPETAKRALAEMVRQTGRAVFDENGLMKKGVIVRHLLLPGAVKNAKAVVKYVYETYGDTVWLSLMSQYTPVGDLAQWPELQHPISPELNDEMYQYLIESPIADGFYQDLDAATGDMIPAFDGTGV